MGRSGVEVGSSHIHAANDEIGSNVTLSNQPIRVVKKVQLFLERTKQCNSNCKNLLIKSIPRTMQGKSKLSVAVGK